MTSAPLRRLASLLSVALALAAPARAVELKVCQADRARYGYRIELAKLILARTAAPGETVTIRPFERNDPAQQRCVQLLRDRVVDLVYLPPTQELLARFDAIRIDLHQGMLGYRLLLINRKDAEAFAQVQSLADLRRFTGGFGRQWADFPLFARNGLPVVTAAQSANLLAMLDTGRFHYFHRGLHEAWAELAQHPQFGDVMVEPHLALRYRFPVYFMFNRSDTALRERFERGFAQILADGSFRTLFLAEFGAIVYNAQLKQRTIIDIDFPLPPGLPPVDTKLWLE